jgi:hypothetical protein
VRIYDIVEDLPEDGRLPNILYPVDAGGCQLVAPAGKNLNRRFPQIKQVLQISED